MMITGGFLALDAEVVDQKLNVTGGVLDWIEVAPPRDDRVEGAWLVTLLQAGPDDHQRPYRMVIELVDADGNVATVSEREVDLGVHSGENRFWVTPMPLPATRSGRMVVIVTIDDGGSVTIPIHVHVLDAADE